MPRSPLSYMSYAQYLGTPRGLRIRESALRYAGYRCQICNSSGVLKIFHRTYENLGYEQECDILVLCPDCYEVVEEQKRKICTSGGPLSAYPGHFCAPRSLDESEGDSLPEPTGSKEVAKEPTLLERGVTAFQEGAVTQPKLATALGISPWQARQLMPQIEFALKESSKDE